MNVFVLCTGRCGSETFSRACRNMTNYSVAHEGAAPWNNADAQWLPYQNLNYPKNHIEVDNRLCWFLGALDEAFGKDAFYVHLYREREDVAASLARRGKNSILYAFASGILQFYSDACKFDESRKLELGRLYWDTVTSNIKLFLRDKPNSMTMSVQQAKSLFPQFWSNIGATGDLAGAIEEWNTHHNRSPVKQNVSWR